MPAVVNVFMSRDVFIYKQVVERRLKLLVKVDKLTISALELRARTCRNNEMKIIIQATFNNSTRKSWTMKEILIIQSSRWRWWKLCHISIVAWESREFSESSVFVWNKFKFTLDLNFWHFTSLDLYVATPRTHPWMRKYSASFLNKQRKRVVKIWYMFASFLLQF